MSQEGRYRESEDGRDSPRSRAIRSLPTFGTLATVLIVLLIIGSGTAIALPSDFLSSSADVATPPSATPALADQPSNATASNTPGQVVIVYFYSMDCPYCEEFEAHLDKLDESDIQVKKYRVSLNTEMFKAFLEEYDVPRDVWGATPTIFVGDEYAVGADRAKALVNETLAENQDVPAPDLLESYSTGPQPVTLDLVGTLAVLAAGDAVNPCALAVLLILLTTTLTRHPDNRRRFVAAGLSFSLAILLTYFTMGALLIGGLKTVATITGIDTSFIRVAFGALAIVMGVLSVYDWVADGASLTPTVPQSWRPAMQRYVTGPLWERRSIVTGSFLAGVFVSLFLLPCTSGPYFVAGGLLSSVPWIQIIPLLLLYNAIFILPMVGLTFGVAYGFAKVEEISSWREANIHRLNLVAGLILVILGALIVVGIV